jgi:hypothetical protein
MILSLLIAAAVGAEPPAAAAPKPNPPVTTAPAKTARAKDTQVVCKTEPAPGSRLPIRRCSTVADLRTRQLLDRQELERMQQDRSPGY